MAARGPDFPADVGRAALFAELFVADSGAALVAVAAFRCVVLAGVALDLPVLTAGDSALAKTLATFFSAPAVVWDAGLATGFFATTFTAGALATGLPDLAAVGVLRLARIGLLGLAAFAGFAVLAALPSFAFCVVTLVATAAFLAAFFTILSLDFLVTTASPSYS